MAKIDNKLAVYKDAHKNEGACLGDILRGAMVKKEQVAALVDNKRPQIRANILLDAKSMDWFYGPERDQLAVERVHDAVFFNPVGWGRNVRREDAAVAIRSHDLMAEFVKLQEKAGAIGREFKNGQLIRKNSDSIHGSYSNYMAALDKHGFKQLGAGEYGTVYFHPKKPDRVVKVSRQRDCEWPHYVQWANSLKCTMGPKLYSLKFHSGFYVAVMERVIVDDVPRKMAMSMIEEFRYSARNVLVKEDDVYAVKKNAAIRFCNSKYPKLLAYLRLLRQHNMCGDLHAGNWGVRSDGSVCIFDPTTSVPYDIKKRFPKQRIRTYK